MKLSIQQTLGIVSAEIDLEPGADCGGGRAERERQDEHSGMRAGGVGAG